MTAPDLSALESLLAKATPVDHTDLSIGRALSAKAALFSALPALLAYVRELEQERSDTLLKKACSDALISAAQDMTDAAAKAAALAMRERCAQRAESAQANGSDCAAAIRALEP